MKRQMAIDALSSLLLHATFAYLAVFAASVSSFRHYNVYKKYYARGICRSVVPVYHLKRTDISSAARFATSSEWKYYDGVCTFHIVPPLGYGVILNVNFYHIPSSFDRCESYIEITEDDEITKLCNVVGLIEKTTFSTERNMTVAFHISKEGSDLLRTFSFGDKIQVFNDEEYQLLNGFVLTATAYQRGDPWCRRRQFECSPRRCIWDGFTCDKVYNCGDNGDESDYGESDCGRVQTTTTISAPNDDEISFSSTKIENYKIGLGTAVVALAILGIIYVVWRCRRFMSRRDAESFSNILPNTRPIQHPPPAAAPRIFAVNHPPPTAPPRTFAVNLPPPTFVVIQNFEASSERISPGGVDVEPSADNPPSYWEVAGQRPSEWMPPTVSTAPNENIERKESEKMAAPPPLYTQLGFE